MTRIGIFLLRKPLVSKSWLGTALAFIVASVLMMLAPATASAQFNIEGIIRGALGHGGYRHHARGGEGRHRERRHASRHERQHDEDSASSDKGKDKDALEENATSQKGGDGKPDAKVSRETPAAPSHDASQASDAVSAKPNKTSDDAPSFAPSR